MSYIREGSMQKVGVSTHIKARPSSAQPLFQDHQVGMEGSYHYDSDGEEQSLYFNSNYASGGYNEPACIEVCSDSDYDEGSNSYSLPQQQVWCCCVSESSSEEGRSQPDCPCQYPSSGSDDASSQSESDDSHAESEWETDSGTRTVDGESSGKSRTGSTDPNDSCRNSDAEASSSSWETASTESSSSWEAATTCSCEAAEAACQSCAPAGIFRWDDEPPVNPNCSPADEWMSHPFSEGGGEGGSLVPLPPSEAHLPAPHQRPYNRRPGKMNSSGVGRRQERAQVTEQKRAHEPCTVPKTISAPADPIAARRRRRRRFRWAPLRRRNGRRR